MRTPTAAIVDNATFIRKAFPVLMPQLDVRGAFTTAGALLASRLAVDVVVLELPDSQESPLEELRAGLAALRTLVGFGHVVCLYTHEQRPFVHAACLASGAAGIVSKAAPATTAQDAFVEVASGGSEFPTELLSRLQQLSEHGGLGVLTPRERQILAARAHGRPMTAIAALLDEPEERAVTEWRATAQVLREFLSCASLDMICRLLDLDPEYLPDIWPTH
ncbi:helix-turn-helix domain-containing protein [Cumulibacter manganitolerans]|uniref:response regulator transcription factor n=1 Tax=Cumulibacter manganitolerans TaxID=1884992 RepID=UPI001297F82B|nr:response regulator transcription factor [Cumulibacter manganitolerans]